MLNIAEIQTTHDIRSDLTTHAFSVMSASDLLLSPAMQAAWEELQAAYPALPVDEYLPGAARYRFRRWGRFQLNPITGALNLLPHTTYFQSTDINEVTGGIVRDFAPLTDDLAQNPFLHELIRFDFAQFPLTPEQKVGPWTVDAHLMRVIAQPGESGQPTPEGIHRDGAEFVTVHIAELENVTGGMVTIYDDDKQPIESFTLQNVLDAYLFEDPVVWHGVTPIRPVGDFGMRSILTFDYHFAG